MAEVLSHFLPLAYTGHVAHVGTRSIFLRHQDVWFTLIRKRWAAVDVRYDSLLIFAVTDPSILERNVFPWDTSVGTRFAPYSAVNHSVPVRIASVLGIIYAVGVLFIRVL